MMNHQPLLLIPLKISPIEQEILLLLLLLKPLSILQILALLLLLFKLQLLRINILCFFHYYYYFSLLQFPLQHTQLANSTITFSNSTPTNPCFNCIHYYYYLTCIILIHYYHKVILLHTLYYYTSCVYSYWYCSLKPSRLYMLGIQFQSIQWI